MCKVCDREVANQQKFRFWDSDYCSLYCQRFDELGLSKIPLSPSKHHSGIFKWPAIKESCENCGAEFDLHWAVELANRAFCSQKCNNQNPSRRRAKKHYFPLKILKHAREPMIAQDIAKRTDPILNYRMTPIAVSQIMPSYIKHGLVKKQMTNLRGFPVATYEITAKGKSLPIKSYLM